MSDLYIKVKSAVAGSKGILPLKSGQTTSYATNDDGDLQRGRATDFNTIPYLNPYGDNFRFTDELGGQTFTNNIIIDWSTWDGVSSVNGYCHSIFSATSGIQDWTDWMLNSPYTCSTFGDWYVSNISEVWSILNWDLTFNLNGYPFNIPNNSNYRFYMSSTNPSNTAQTWFKNHNGNLFSLSLKTSPRRAMLIRTFTVSGTTLS